MRGEVLYVEMKENSHPKRGGGEIEKGKGQINLAVEHRL